jgi:hypothetical protein
MKQSPSDPAKRGEVQSGESNLASSPRRSDGRDINSPENDAIIGRAFRWSVLLIAVLAAAAAGLILLLNRKPSPGKTSVASLQAPEAREISTRDLPAAKFTEITAAAGVQFVHNNGAYGDKLLPETMGGGVAFLDFDGEGDQDLLFVNSTYWPGKIPEGQKPATPALYRNDGTGQFQDVTAGSGIDISLYGMGVAVGDYDNDGLVDVFITAVGGNRLFHNLGQGKFADVTAMSGVGGSPTGWSTSAAWIDHDNDGDLDLFVCTYVQWSRWAALMAARGISLARFRIYIATKATGGSKTFRRRAACKSRIRPPACRWPSRWVSHRSISTGITGSISSWPTTPSRISC